MRIVVPAFGLDDDAFAAVRDDLTRRSPGDVRRSRGPDRLIRFPWPGG
jgi:hypothetical protein